MINSFMLAPDFVGAECDAETVSCDLAPLPSFDCCPHKKRTSHLLRACKAIDNGSRECPGQFCPGQHSSLFRYQARSAVALSACTQQMSHCKDQHSRVCNNV